MVWEWSFGVVSHEAGLFLWVPLSVCGPLHKEVGWGGKPNPFPAQDSVLVVQFPSMNGFRDWLG